MLFNRLIADTQCILRKFGYQGNLFLELELLENRLFWVPVYIIFFKRRAEKNG